MMRSERELRAALRLVSMVLESYRQAGQTVKVDRLSPVEDMLKWAVGDPSAFQDIVKSFARQYGGGN